jgi:hypothetical protein
MYPGSDLWVVFTPFYGKPMNHPMSASVRNVEISAVCHEARTEYLFANPKFLIAHSGGKIHYNPDTTIIYIMNWDIMAYGIADAITSHLLSGLPVDKWVSEIKRLAVRKQSLMNDMRHVMLMTGLEQLIAVVEPPKRAIYGLISDLNEWLKSRKEVLEATKSRIAPNSKVPRMSLIHQDKMGGKWYHGA